MEHYVEGHTVENIDSMTAEIKPPLIALLGRVEEKNRSGDAPKRIAVGPVSREKQQAVWEMILKIICLVFVCGRVDFGSHTTIVGWWADDVLVVYSFAEDDFWGGIFNILHCGGRGIYQQSISKELMGTLLAEVPSFAVEEAIGRLYENIIGKREGFWQYIYETLVEILPQLKACRGIYMSPSITRSNR